METRKILNMIQAAAVCLLVTTSTAVYAEQEDELMMRRGASTDEIMGTLRGFRRPTNEAEPTAAKALAVRVYFEYNSAELTAETRAELANYGKSLASEEFKGARWAIEGHTDASGATEYNKALSEQRANSVYNYLIDEFGMNPNQLVPIGKGESELYDPANPKSGVNRRVRIKYLGG